MKKFFKLFLGVILAVVFFYLIVREVDWPTFRRALTAANLWFLCLSLGVLALDYATRITRWWWMLRKLEPTLPLRNCITPFLFSYALNNLLPLRAGDIMRVVGFRRQLQSPEVRVLGTLVIERLLDLLVILGFLVIGLAGLTPGALPESWHRLAISLNCLVFLSVLFVILAPNLINFILARLAAASHLGAHAWLGKIRTWMGQFLEALTLCRSPVFFLQLLAFSIVAWVLEGAVFALVSYSVMTQTAPLGPWFSLAAGTLATLLPSTPGYLGTFDYFALKGLMAYGARHEEALAFALLIHAVLWLPVTLAGLVSYLASRGMSAWPLRKRQVLAND